MINVKFTQQDMPKSWTIGYCLDLIRLYIKDKKGIDPGPIQAPRNRRQLAMFEKATTVAFQHFGIE